MCITKICRVCNKPKLLEELKKDRKALYGRDGKCKDCHNKERRLGGLKHLIWKSRKKKPVYNADGVEIRKCFKCDETKIITDFKKHSESIYRRVCKDCFKLYERKRQKARKRYESRKLTKAYIDNRINHLLGDYAKVKVTREVRALVRDVIKSRRTINKIKEVA